MSVGLNTFLRKALANKNKVDIGQFHLLNLDAIKEKVGDHWPSMRAKIFEASTHFIEKRIGNDDVMVSCEEGFLIIFCENDADPQEEIEKIGEELQRFFLGEPDMQDVKVAGEARSVSASELAEIATPTPPPSSAQPPRAVPASAEAEAEDPRRALKAATAKIPTKPGLKAHFQPVWDSARQMVISNICLTKVYVEGRLISGRRAIDTRMADVEQHELDLCSIRGTVEAFLFYFQKKRKVSFVQTVHWDTLSDETMRNLFIAPLNALPKQFRSAFMIRVDELPWHDPAARAVLDEFRDLGFTNVVEMPFGTEDLDMFGPHEVGLFGSVARRPSNFESEGFMDHDIAALRSFVQQAKNQGAGTYLEDVRDLKTLKDGMNAGIRFFAGSSIYEDAVRPLPPAPLSMVDLCRRAKAA